MELERCVVDIPKLLRQRADRNSSGKGRLYAGGQACQAHGLPASPMFCDGENRVGLAGLPKGEAGSHGGAEAFIPIRA